jgi:hypothetical protein
MPVIAMRRSGSRSGAGYSTHASNTAVKCDTT